MSGHTPWREIRHKRRRLRCESCGRVDETGRAEGWRAPLGREDGDQVVAVVLCPACAREVDEDAG